MDDQKRVRRNGRLVKQKKPKSAANARTPIHWLVSGQNSVLFFKNPLDKRTALGKEYERSYTALVNHLGGEDNITEPERSLADYAAKHSLLASINWARLVQDGLFDENNEVHPALDCFRKSVREHRDLLKLLGLQRRQREVADLSAYIKDQEVS